jgi:hypothetical protein
MRPELRPERWPDWMARKKHIPPDSDRVYKSTRALGKVYRLAAAEEAEQGAAESHVRCPTLLPCCCRAAAWRARACRAHSVRRGPWATVTHQL